MSEYIPRTRSVKQLHELDRDDLIDGVESYVRRFRPLTRQDAVGCAIAWEIFSVFPVGEGLRADLAAAWRNAVVQHFLVHVPDAMDEARFSSPLLLTLNDQRRVAVRRFLEWSAAVFDTRKTPESYREEALQALWRVEISPRISDTQRLSALKKASRLAASYYANKWGATSVSNALDPDEVENELWLNARGGVIRRGKDGEYGYDSRTIRDSLRSRRNAPVASVTIDSCRESTSGGPGPSDGLLQADTARIVREVLDRGRRRGLAVDEAFEYLTTDTSRAEIARLSEKTEDSIRHAERWLETEVRRVASD